MIFISNIKFICVNSNESDPRVWKEIQSAKIRKYLSSLEFSSQEFPSLCHPSTPFWRWQCKIERTNFPERSSYQLSFYKMTTFTFEHITLYRRMLNISKLYLSYSSIIA